MKLIGLLVGQSFRPPAKLLLQALPTGSPLVLEPEPTNPYDEFAIKVLVDPQQLDSSKYDWLAAELPSMGCNLAEILDARVIQLGYLARQGNKALLPTNALAGSMILDLANGDVTVGKLCWGPNGETLVEIEQ